MAKHEKIEIFLRSGQSYEWIAKELKISKSTIAKLKKIGKK